MAGVDWEPRAGLEQKPGVRAAQLAQLELSGELFQLQRQLFISP